MEDKKSKKLEIIIFTSGAVVMILELIGSRILAPYLGASIFVWTSLIGIILAALSLGYYIGGRISKKNPTIDFLAIILFASGIGILFIPIFKDIVLSIIKDLGPQLGSVVATLILFIIPSVLLGTVSPYAIRLKTENVESVGNVAGNLYALSTIGSITGTFLAGFFLIPAFGSVQILFGLSFVLILLSLLIKFNKSKVYTIFLVITISVISLYTPNLTVYETDSIYNHIRVVDSKNSKGELIRILYLATDSHSIKYLNSDKLYASYHKAYALDELFKSNIKTALTLGGGAYSGPMNFINTRPQATMDVVEIDPKVTQTARDYFDLEYNDRLSIYHQDARIFLNNNKKIYDVVYGDAFSSTISIPFHLTTVETMEMIKNSLAEDGVFILNTIAIAEGKGSDFFKAELKTITYVFPQVYVFPLANSGRSLDERQNIVIIASKKSQRLSKQDLTKNASQQQIETLEKMYEKDIDLDNVKLLTDNFAPVDYYISKTL